MRGVEGRRTTIADFTTIRSQFNPGTDAAPTWNTITFGGSAGANELRWCATGAGTTTTASASWPQYARPASTGAVPEMWGFSADATGIKCTTYDGNKTFANVMCIDYDAVGTYAAAPTLSAWGEIPTLRQSRAHSQARLLARLSSTDTPRTHQVPAISKAPFMVMTRQPIRQQAMRVPRSRSPRGQRALSLQVRRHG